MQLGRYVVEREIGRGGMGAVYLARTQDGRAVAIKVLLRQGSRDAAARFERERRLLAEIGKGFVPLVDAGMGPQGPFLVMPFVSGGTLKDKIEKGPLPIEEAVQLASALATAMGRAHAQGVVHRDLKPENVLFTDSGFPLIADLGLAKHFGDGAGSAESVSLSKTGVAVGTAGYMAPEQLNDAKSAGPPADVFALGAILYEMLTGTPAFAGDNVHQRHARVASGDYEPVRKVRSEVPRWLGRVVERALRSRPQLRYADGNELAAAIAARDPGRRLWPFVLGGGAVVALVATAVFLGRPGAAPPSTPASPPAPTPPPVVATPKPTPHTLVVPPEVQKTKLTQLAHVLGDPAWKSFGGGAAGIGFMPGGGCVAASDDEILVFDTKDGRLLRHFKPGLGSLMSIDVARDGASVLVTSHAGISGLVSLASEKVRVRLEGQTGQIYSGRIFPDGLHAATVSDDWTVRAWDLETGRELWNRNTGGCAFVCAVTPDGTKVLSGGARSWDTKAWNAERVPESSVPMEKRHGWGIQTWDARTGGPGGTYLGLLKLAHGLTISDDGKLVVGAGYDCTVRVWDFATGELLRTLDGHKGPIRPVRFLGRSSRIVTGSYGLDHTIRLWDLARKAHEELVATLGDGPANLDGTGDIAVSPDGKTFVSQGTEGIHLWDGETGKELSTVVGHSRRVTGAALSKDGKTALTASLDGTLRVWDVEHEQERVLNPNNGGVVAAALSPDGRQAISAHEKGALLLWDLERGASRKLEGHAGRITAVAFGERLALSAAEDQKVLAWDPTDGRPLGTLEGMPRPHSISIAEDGEHFIVAGIEGVRRFESLQLDKRIEGVPIAAAAFDRKGTKVLIGTTDSEKSLGTWDLVDSNLRYFSRDIVVEALAATPDLSLAVTAGADGVRIWDGIHGQEIDRIDFTKIGDTPTAVGLSQDRRRLVVGTARGQVFVFGFR